MPVEVTETPSVLWNVVPVFLMLHFVCGVDPNPWSFSCRTAGVIRQSMTFGLAYQKPQQEILSGKALNVIVLILCMLSTFTDAFVNSQEWTLSRSVPELKVVSLF